MTHRIVNSLKYLLVFSIVLFGSIACEKDFEDVGVNIVDNNLFNTKDSVFEVLSYSKNVERSMVGNNFGSANTVRLPIFNVGILNDPNFGVLRSSFISQLGYSANLDSLRTRQDVVIDTVIIDIPYFSTRIENNDNGTPNFSLDSIFGAISEPYNLKVHRLGTFLNTLDPGNPTQSKSYYSDESYGSLNLLLDAMFSPNANDTVLYVKRGFFEGTESIDTIKKEDLSPSIKLPLDELEVKKIFRDEANASNFTSTESFRNYFRGIIISPEGNEGSSMALAMTDATLNIYYTYVVLTDEDGTDLNDNGTTDDLDVPVYTKQTLSLPFSGIQVSTYNRDYSGSTIESFIQSPDQELGENKLYVQGSAGSIAEFELFKEIAIEELKANGWLINGAILDVYVDESSGNDIPERLYLYNAEENSIILDAISEAASGGIGGFLERDEDTNEPIRYRFTMTDYLSQVLGSDFEDRALAGKFAIKTYHATDAPQSFTDTIIRDFSWINKGVVLKGNNIEESAADFDQRLKLRIYYTENTQKN